MYRILLLFSILNFSFADWPQGPGPNYDYTIEGDAPNAFSASINKGIKWRVALPEIGQSSPVIVGDKIFLTCFKPVSEDTKDGLDTLAMCFDKSNGELLWQKVMKGNAVTRISGCFGDNSGPAAVSDGKSVCFFNASGLINKYDLDGNLQWSINIKNSRRSDPFLMEGVLVITGSAELEKIEGRHIKGIDYSNGKLLWQSESHSWDGLTLVPYERENGEWVGLIARGGGHVKAEYTDGYELISLKTGKSFWKTEFKNFRSTQNFTLRNDKAYIFLPNGVHRIIDLENGKVLREDKLLSGAMVADHDGSKYVYKELDKKINLKKRSITQMSNLVVD